MQAPSIAFIGTSGPVPTHLQVLVSDKLQARGIVARLCPGVHIDDLAIALVFEHEAIDILCNGLQQQKELEVMQAQPHEGKVLPAGPIPSLWQSQTAPGAQKGGLQQMAG